MKEIVEVIAKALVDRPEAVEVSEEEQERATLLKLHAQRTIWARSSASRAASRKPCGRL